MNTGIIFQHFWNEQQHPLEKLCHNNTKKLIDQLPSHLPILTVGVTILEIMSQIKNKFHNIVEYQNTSVLSKDLETVIESWVMTNQLNRIYIAGLHFNCCVMQVASLLKDISYKNSLNWGDTFVVKIIKECTVSLDIDEKNACALQDTKLHMNYELVKPWLIDQNEILQ